MDPRMYQRSATLPKIIRIAVLAVAIFLWVRPVSMAQARSKKGKRAASARRSRKGVRPGQPGVKHFTFEDMLVDGEVLKPQMLYTKVLDRAKFERLLRLRKSFLTRMLKSFRYPCLRRGW